ncbi:unnamed protein product [Cochlearia groenlandica]
MNECSLTQARVLGQGSQGSVTLMVDKDSQSKVYAKKTSPMQLLSSLQTELNIMIRFRDHPYIVRASSPLVYTENNEEGEKVCYIYMEYANKRTLDNMISKYQGKSLPEYMIHRAARMILQGLDALHSQGYVHCDLKPSNILLFHSTTHGEPFDLKLADFGLSKEPNTRYVHPRGLYPGTPDYMSPESIGPNGLVDQALDVWSLGCVVYEMFGGEAKKVSSENHYEWSLVKDISPLAKDFLKRCHGLHPSLRRDRAAEIDCTDRATAAELLNHPFIRQGLCGEPLPTTRRQKIQKYDWPLIPRLPGSIW